MPASGSVTGWIRGLKAGDAEAMQRLWDAYCKRLVRVARRQLATYRNLGADEEDVVLSVFDSLFRRAGDDQFSRLDDRSDLWQILVVITRRKAVNLRKYARRQKRGEGHAHLHLDDIAGLVAREPDPEFAVQVAEECDRLLDQLEKPHLKSVALLKMEGYSNKEIAARLQRSVPTVERKLALIRKIWQNDASSQ
jgi:RNA polymerase sigma factor (sigma-70 family)